MRARRPRYGFVLSEYLKLIRFVIFRCGSIPDVSFVVFDFVTAQKNPEFFLEGRLFVMIRLRLNVLFHRFELRLPDGKRAVFVLPAESPKILAFGFDPFRGTGFNLFDEIGDGDRPRQVAYDMQMVFHAADFMGVRFAAVANGRKVRI
jgi:hypothetical protein